jgi:hypothetical protein
MFLARVNLGKSPEKKEIFILSLPFYWLPLTGSAPVVMVSFLGFSAVSQA